MQKENLNRFIQAQQSDYQNAFNEITAGRKRSHWMWYIFPQIDGLGFSAMSKKYAIEDIREAEAYLNHPILGERIISISKQLIKLTVNNATQIFGSPDDMKLRSSMTLFACVPGADPVFSQVLSKFFNGDKDPQTIALLR